MLPRQNRVHKQDFPDILKKAKNIDFGYFYLKYLLDFKENPLNKPKLSIVIPKKIAKLAVNRNKIKRLASETVAKYIKNYAPVGFVGIIFFKKTPERLNMAYFKTIFKDFLNYNW